MESEKKDFLGSIRSGWRGLWPKRGEEHADEPATERPAEGASPLAEQAQPSKDPLALLAEAIEHQHRQAEALSRRLAELTGGIERLLEAQQSQAGIIGAMQEVPHRLTADSEELSGAMRDLAAEGQRQTELLHNIHASLASFSQADPQVAAALRRLADVLENVEKSNAAHVHLLEQIRDRLAGANPELNAALLKQGRQVSRATGWLIVLAAAIAALLAAAVLLPALD